MKGYLVIASDGKPIGVIDDQEGSERPEQKKTATERPRIDFARRELNHTLGSEATFPEVTQQSGLSR